MRISIINIFGTASRVLPAFLFAISDLMTNAAANSVVVRPSIADPSALSELLSYAASDFLHRVVGVEEIPAEEVQEIIFGLAGIFRGDSEIVDLPRGWNLAEVGARLRPGLKPVLDAMTPEDRAIFKNDDELIVLAIHCYFEQMIAFAEEAGLMTPEKSGPEMKSEAIRNFLADALVIEECSHWAKWLLGEAEESPL